MTNPYGDGHAAERIVEVLANLDIERLLMKAPVLLPDDSEAE
jgi:UDP-N-acetylglucosamine 2-epimerase